MSDFRATSMSGSLTRLVNNNPYLVAGSNVTIETGGAGILPGQIKISATGGGGSSEWTRNGNNLYPNSPTSTTVYFGDTDSGNWDTQIGPDGSAIFNERGAAVDFRIEGDTKTHLFFVDGSTDRIGIGTSIPEALLNVSTNSENGTIFILEQHHDSADAPNMNFFKSRGTNASPATINSGDFIGDIQFNARDINSSDTWARIYAQSYGTVSNTSHPSKIYVQTTPNGSTANQTAAIFGGHSAGSPYGTISGSIHWTVGGIPYLVGSQGVSISSASNGQVTISTPTASDTTYTLTATQDGDNVDVLLDASAGSDSTLQLTAGANVTLTRNSASEVTIAAAADTDTTYTLSATQDGSDVDILLDASAGSDSTLQLTAGSNVTLTRNAADNVTIAATDTNTTYTAGDGLDLSGTEFSLDLKSNSGLDIVSGELAVDVSDFLTNGVNNRVVTATGTDGLNAEENLTFDGSNLIMTGTLHMTSAGGAAAISIDKNNNDAAVLQFGTSPVASSGNTHGFALVYSGSGTGLYNDFTIEASNEGGSDIVAMRMHQDGVTHFSKTHYLLAETFISGSVAVDEDTFVVNVSTDRVGINKAAPDTALHVNGDVTVQESGGDTIGKLYASSDDGVLDLYANNTVKARIHGNGLSYFTGNDGRVAIGDVGTTYLGSPDALLLATSDTTGQTIVSVEQHNNGGDAPNINFVKSRGTQQAPAAINSGDFLGDLVFKGYVGSTAGEASFAQIYVESHGSIVDNSSHPGRFVFRANKAGSTSFSSVMALSGSGVVVTPNLKTSHGRQAAIREIDVGSASSPFFIVSSDHYIVFKGNVPSAGFQVVLPDAQVEGREINIKTVAAGGKGITVTTIGGQTLDGISGLFSFSMTPPSAVKVVANGGTGAAAIWYRFGEYNG